MGPSHTVAFEVSKEFLLRTFGEDKNDDTMKNKIEEIFKLLASSKNEFDLRSSNSDSEESDDDLFSDLGHCEEIALKKRRSKQVLEYLVEKHLRKKQQQRDVRGKFIPPDL